MKTILFMGLVLGLLTSSCSNDDEPETLSTENQVTTQTGVLTANGSNCFSQYAERCNFGNSLVLKPESIIKNIDVENYCQQTSISCSVTECKARLNILMGFLHKSEKNNSCLPIDYKEK